jgi:hypothetical protein
MTELQKLTTLDNNDIVFRNEIIKKQDELNIIYNNDYNNNKNNNKKLLELKKELKNIKDEFYINSFDEIYKIVINQIKLNNKLKVYKQPMI